MATSLEFQHPTNTPILQAPSIELVRIANEDASHYALGLTALEAAVSKATYVTASGSVTEADIVQAVSPDNSAHLAQQVKTVQGLRECDTMIGAWVTSPSLERPVLAGVIQGSENMGSFGLHGDGFPQAAYLDNLQVHPAFKGNGIGSLLLDRFLEPFDRGQMARVQIPHNPRMQQTLEKHGAHFRGNVFVRNAPIIRGAERRLLKFGIRVGNLRTIAHHGLVQHGMRPSHTVYYG
ncbi:MAG TPA: GNAT family protein [Candidatus Saccharimonadales bacterium]|nr:GNAT family protein [Candidatus Saccharimonadales bacterium]